MRRTSLRQPILLLVAVFFPLQSFAQTAATPKPKPSPVPMATYTDPAGDLSFEYPVVWKIDDSAKFYLAPLILQNDLKPLVQVVFLSAENVYAKTTLIDLIFVYAKQAVSSEMSCGDLAQGQIRAKVETVSIDGVDFHRLNASDAAMCHDADQHVYWTYRPGAKGGTCYLFEGDMHTSCPGVAEGHRDLTAAEKKALLRHLNAIPLSIRFSATT